MMVMELLNNVHNIREVNLGEFGDFEKKSDVSLRWLRGWLAIHSY